MGGGGGYETTSCSQDCVLQALHWLAAARAPNAGPHAYSREPADSRAARRDWQMQRKCSISICQLFISEYSFLKLQPFQSRRGECTIGLFFALFLPLPLLPFFLFEDPLEVTCFEFFYRRFCRPAAAAAVECSFNEPRCLPRGQLDGPACQDLIIFWFALSLSLQLGLL